MANEPLNVAVARGPGQMWEQVAINRPMWRCPACGYEMSSTWSFVEVSDQDHRVVASARSCPVCLARKINELVPQMEPIDG